MVRRHLARAGRDGLDGLVPVGYRAVRVADPDGVRPLAGAVVDVLATYDPSIVVVDGADGTPALAAAGVVHGARVLALDDHGGGSHGGLEDGAEQGLPSSSPRTRPPPSRSQPRTEN